jgi:hypothetical protein
MKLDLNVFTNFCTPDVSQIPLFRDIPTFLSTFGKENFHRVRIFCDPGPIPISIPSFLDQCRATSCFAGAEIFVTRGLADGYIQSIDSSDADFLFQLEHDWLLAPGLLSHGFVQICELMRKHRLPWLVFNRSRNFDKAPNCQQLDFTSFPVCLVTYFTNCPHIIDRSYAAEHLVPFIDRNETGSRGIERELTHKFGQGWIYGPHGHPAISTHCDGKELLRSWRRAGLKERTCEIYWKARRRMRDRLSLNTYGKIGQA